ncbi:hypothetical protein MAR_001476 [Mya arenaria]|uniref:Phytanoyl-CoA dioxygenase family protein n=1 Tax=Mya arenaria TaxID=6604 RepID=A0ABY7FBW1_MYAAR|nr:hypothetical protein MAR_001476 [Mya arenaria]
MEQLIGPDIAGNPAWNLRTKVPRNIVTTVPWHQDVSYLDNDKYRMLIPTAWITFVDATEQNGCLECCWGDTFYTILEEDEMKNTLGVDLDRDKRALPVRSGGLILFNNMIPHRSLPNVSDGIRWSIDLRWQRATDPAGLWGLKNGVVMRKSSDPNFKVDWTEFDSVNRHIVQTEYIKGDKAVNVSYLDNDKYRMLIPTAWITFVDATEQNGCLECCWGDTFYTILEEDEMKNTLGVDLDRDKRALPVRSGGLILFNNMIPHRSLPNVSDGIRWSIDLRWQRATDPAGLWGLKNGVVMRKSSDPNFKVDWTEFDSVNRHIVQTEYIKGDKAGPWMKKWEIVHMNKHVDRFLEQEAASKGDKSVST